MQRRRRGTDKRAPSEEVRKAYEQCSAAAGWRSAAHLEDRDGRAMSCDMTQVGDEAKIVSICDVKFLVNTERVLARLASPNPFADTTFVDVSGGPTPAILSGAALSSLTLRLSQAGRMLQEAIQGKGANADIGSDGLFPVCPVAFTGWLLGYPCSYVKYSHKQQEDEDESGLHLPPLNLEDDQTNNLGGETLMVFTVSRAGYPESFFSFSVPISLMNHSSLTRLAIREHLSRNIAVEVSSREETLDVVVL